MKYLAKKVFLYNNTNVMKKLSTFISIVAIALAAVAGFTGCDKPDLSVKGVALNAYSLSLNVGETSNLTASVNPADATNKAVTWSSSDASVASVDNSGKVTALKDGTATITATSADTGVQANCKVTVTDPSKVKGMTIKTKTLALSENQSKALEVEIQPETAANKKVSWKSSDASVATVSDDGVVKGIALGSADITATSDDGGFTATCKVTVKAADIYAFSTSGDPRTSINGQTYKPAAGVVSWFYSDGKDFYEGIRGTGDSVTGCYKNGVFWASCNPSYDYPLMGIVDKKEFFLNKFESVLITDGATGATLFKKQLKEDAECVYLDMVVAQDGTAYVAGYYRDDSHSSGGAVATMWTISNDQKTVTETVLKSGSTYETFAESIALDKDGNVWVLAYRPEGLGNDGVKLYKNGSYQRTVFKDATGNFGHHLGIDSKNDFYIVGTSGDMKKVRLYKNNSVVYTITTSTGFVADTKPYFSLKGDVFFAVGSNKDYKAYIYKNGELKHTIDGPMITHLAIVF